MNKRPSHDYWPLHKNRNSKERSSILYKTCTTYIRIGIHQHPQSSPNLSITVSVVVSVSCYLLDDLINFPVLQFTRYTKKPRHQIIAIFPFFCRLLGCHKHQQRTKRPTKKENIKLSKTDVDCLFILPSPYCFLFFFFFLGLRSFISAPLLAFIFLGAVFFECISFLLLSPGLISGTRQHEKKNTKAKRRFVAIVSNDATPTDWEIRKLIFAYARLTLATELAKTNRIKLKSQHWTKQYMMRIHFSLVQIYIDACDQQVDIFFSYETYVDYCM